MRFEIIKTVFLKELRETLRDRRSLAVMFGIPLLLYPVLTLGLASLGSSRQKAMTDESYKVVVTDALAAPQLLQQIKDQASKLTLVEGSADLKADLAARRIDAVLMVPPDAERLAMECRSVTITIQVDGSRTESPVIEKRVEKMLAAYQDRIIRARLDALKPPATQAVLEPIVRDIKDVSTDTQRLGKLLSMLLPNVLLLTGMLGAFFPALNATTTEREAGTLETLLVTPAGRTELLVAKCGMVLLTSLATAALNLVSMSLVIWRVASSFGPAMGTLSLSPSAIALTYLAAVPALIFFSALVMVVGLFARNFREANSYATPVMLLPLISVAVGIAEPKATAALLCTPVVNTTIIIRDVLTAHVSAGAFVLAFISSCLYAGLMLGWAARMFSSEQLVNPAWEPLSLRGLRGIKLPRRPRLPAMDEALILFAVTLLLVFYVQPSLHGLLPAITVTEILLIALPAFIFAGLGNYRIKETFSLRRPSVGAMLGAALIGIGLAPCISLVGHFQNKIWPVDPQQAKMQFDLLANPLLGHPILTVAIVGALAGICEEILYRGPIQTGLRRKLSLWPAVIAGGILFAAAHMDVHGLPIRALLGVLLGWVVIRSGSIFPAMLLHGLYDATQLSFMAHGLHQAGGLDAFIVAAAHESPFSATNLTILAIGAVLAAGGLWLFLRAAPRTPGDPGFDHL